MINSRSRSLRPVTSQIAATALILHWPISRSRDKSRNTLVKLGQGLSQVKVSVTAHRYRLSRISAESHRRAHSFTLNRGFSRLCYNCLCVLEYEQVNAHNIEYWPWEIYRRILRYLWRERNSRDLFQAACVRFALRNSV